MEWGRAMNAPERRLLAFSLSFKTGLLLLQIVFNLLILDHDARVFNPPTNESSQHIADTLVDFIFAGLKRWDGIYYLHIAEHGYTYENCLAFFPLFPLFTAMLANTVLFPLQFVSTYSRTLLVSAVCFNILCSAVSSVLLYRLGQMTLANHNLAYKAALLFNINPAAIFTIAPYSESLFTLLTFFGMLQIQQHKNTKAAIAFGLSSFTRSNGIASLGFIFYFKIKEFIKMMISKINRGSHQIISKGTVSEILLNILWPLVFQCFLCLIFFAIYQIYTFHLYCTLQLDLTSLKLPLHVITYGNEQGMKFPGSGMSDWCHDTVPLSYGYIQKHYWNVGFLNYFKIKQIPNFLLALPMTVLCLSSALHYSSVRKDTFWSLGFTIPRKMIRNNPREQGFDRPEVFVYIVHMLFFTLFSFFCIHVQVLTRLLASSSPVVYWYAAYLMTSPWYRGKKWRKDVSRPKQKKHKKHGSSYTEFYQNLRYVVMNEIYSKNIGNWKVWLAGIYFLSYAIIGTIAFSNFFPWT